MEAAIIFLAKAIAGGVIGHYLKKGLESIDSQLPALSQQRADAEVFDRKYLQEEELTTQEHVHALYNYLKGWIDICEALIYYLLRFEILPKLKILALYCKIGRTISRTIQPISHLGEKPDKTDKADYLEELLKDKKSRGYKELRSVVGKETFEQMLETSLQYDDKIFMHELVDTIRSANEIAKTQKLTISKLSTHTLELRFFFEREGYPELAEHIFENSNKFFTSLGMTQQKLSAIRLAMDTGAKERETELFELIYNLFELSGEIQSTMQSLMEFAKKMKK